MPDLNDHPQELALVLHTRVVTGNGGGPDKTILNSPRYLPPLGYRAMCAFLHPPGDQGFENLCRTALRRDAPLISIEDRGAPDFSVIRKILEICRNKQVSVWHSHDYKSNLLGLLIRPFHRMRLVTTVHGWVTHGSRLDLYYQIDRMCLPHYERVICVSEDLRNESISAGVPEWRCALIENAIEASEYRRNLSPSVAKVRIGLNPDRLLIGAVGRLSTEKAYDVLIGAFRKVVDGGADVQLVIAGEGNERPRLESLIVELQLQDRVQLLGYRADTIDLYQAMDISVLSSLREGLPNVVLEAMAMEVPLVATRIAGIPRIVEHDQNGLLVTAGRVDELATALFRLVESAELRSRLAAAARTTIESRYSFDVRMKKVAAVYDSLGARGATFLKS